MRRTKEDAEKTRCAILAAAEQLFLERGVAHTSLEHIARHAGVTRGAVYWHFQNKAHLFHEMLNQVRLPLEPLAQQLAAVDGLSSLQLLRDLCIEAMANLVLDEQRRRILTVDNERVDRELNCVLSNSFGFGGTNATLAFTRVAA